MAEAADDQPRQCRAVGRKLEIEHPLRIARGLLGNCRMALQQAYPPTAGGQAGGRGATGQTGADHQGMAFASRHIGAGEPGFGAATGFAEEPALEHFPFLAQARHAFDAKARVLKTAANQAGAAEGAESGAGGA